jgi:hypothetical protein
MKLQSVMHKVTGLIMRVNKAEAQVLFMRGDFKPTTKAAEKRLRKLEKHYGN